MKDGGAVCSVQFVFVDAETPEFEHGAAFVVEVGGGGHQRRNVGAVVVEELGDHVCKVGGLNRRKIILNGEGTAVFFGRGSDLVEELQEGLIVELAVKALYEDAVDAVLLHPSEMGIHDASAVGFEERGV